MNRSVIGLVVLLSMTTLVPTAQAAARIPSADEFSNGPKSHMDPSEMTSSTTAGVPQMRVDWELIHDRHGRSMIEGYVYNSDGVAMNAVRLRVDSLDAGGAPVSSELRAINSLVPSEGRTYFEFPAPSPAANYHVTVESADPVEGTQ